jgi:hypothetical protein
MNTIKRSVSEYCISIFSIKHLVFVLFLSLINCQVFAQQAAGSISDVNSSDPHELHNELGVHVGNLLPNDIKGVTEIISMWGGEYGFRWGKSFVELGGVHGREGGVKWTNFHLGLRIDVQIDSLIIYSKFGIDYVHYISDISNTDFALGSGHVGGGVITKISENVWFRLGLKFNVRPGTSLYFGGGFMLRLGKRPDPPPEEDDEEKEKEEEDTKKS